MKVILIQSVKGLGEPGAIKEVADGYGSNFLIPQGLAQLGTDENISKWNSDQESKIKMAEVDLALTEKIAEQLNGLTVEISGKANEAGKLYASVNGAMIVKKLKELGFDLKKEQIVLMEPIKEPGDHPVMVSLDHGLEAEINLIVSV
ncbi:MAG: 50S ribosomal protein L9 [Patescibacteria group bacterium]